MGDMTEDQTVLTLPLDAWHRAQGARMVPFAGYHMPVQYEGIIAEHLWTRGSAGLFDVSHMGQLTVHGARRGGPAELRQTHVVQLDAGRYRQAQQTARSHFGLVQEIERQAPGASRR